MSYYLDLLDASLTLKNVAFDMCQDWIGVLLLPVEVDEKLEDLEEIESSSNNSYKFCLLNMFHQVELSWSLLIFFFSYLSVTTKI